MSFRLRSVSASILLILLHPHSPPPPSPPSSTVFRYKGKISELHVFPTRLFSFVLRLYSLYRLGCRSPTVFVLRLYRLYSACTRLYRLACRPPWVFVLRLYSSVLVCINLYSFVQPGLLFPLSICIPFVFVCTLTPFCEYNTIRRREAYKSTENAQM